MTVTPLYSAEKYTYRVVWSEDGQQHVGHCHEFPDLHYLATTPAEALAGIIDLVRTELREAKEIPVPLSIALARARSR